MFFFSGQTRKTKRKRKSKNPQNKKQKKTRSTRFNRLTRLNCSPKSNKNNTNKFSCYTNETLQKLRFIWNKHHPNKKIISTVPKAIHLALTNEMKKTCKNEACWLNEMKQLFGSDTLFREFMSSFSPSMPKKWEQNPTEWLSSDEINNVMHQYEKAYKCFQFIGPSPIDFNTRVEKECVWRELCEFNLAKQIQKGKTKIGMIFNTDTHDKPGAHWISMFVNIKKGQIFFFDSVGDTAPEEIQVLVATIMKQGKMLSPPIQFVYDENYPVEHQYKNTECGIYSLFFIIHLLEDKVTSNYFKTHKLKDAYMHTFRKKYFNSSQEFQ